MTALRLAALVALVVGGLASAADDPVHLGVASCAGSTCHGAVRPIGRHPIRQDEYLVWQRKDSHAGAYQVLLEPRSDAMTRRLGWGPAREAKGCLVCHADAPAEKARGEKWLVTDGVGCEVCHGGSGHWIETHTRGYKSRDEARRDGLYPTWDEAARGAMCLSCHQGSQERPMTHAIMASGHPALLFELDTFMALEPYHHEIDADYIERKGAQDSARTWVLGQVMAADQLLSGLAEGRHRDGLFPELAFFDCDACHHSMKAGRADTARSLAPLPGAVPLGDDALVLVDAWAQAVDPAGGQRWRTARAQLVKQGYTDPASLGREADKLRTLLREEWLPKAQSTTLDAGQVRRVLGGVLAAAAGPHHGDYAYGEQTAMASLVLGSAIASREGHDLPAATKAAIDALYATLKDRDRFDPAAYAAAVSKVKAALGI